jgi:predicted transcriptional regulator
MYEQANFHASGSSEQPFKDTITDKKEGFEGDLPIFSRIAIYDNLKSIPRVLDFSYLLIDEFLSEIPQKVYSFSHELGGKIPYTILKEIIENLIHANFKDIIISIMDTGNTIIISDQGPGITDKERAFLPGYTSATRSMKKYIRGVGSGLPIVKETIFFSGGSIDIKDNLKQGTVVSLKIGQNDNGDGILSIIDVKNNAENKTGKDSVGDFSAVKQNDMQHEKIPPSENKETPETGKNIETALSTAPSSEKDFPALELTIRHKKILSLILELEESGPARIAKELSFSLSTSYRELVFLESIGFLELTESGKRKLTTKGKKYLEYYSNSF